MPRSKGSKVWNYDSIKKEIDERGDQLISTGKMTSQTTITILCRFCHQEFAQRFDHYNTNTIRNCACPSKKKQWNIDTVRAYVEKEGDTLVTNEYVNNKTLLSIKCGK